MTRMILVSVALLGLVCYFIFRWQALVTAAQPPLLTRVDIYSDRIEYRNGSYASASTLSIAMKANTRLPEVVAVHDCAAVSMLPGVLDVIRLAGAVDFQIELPEDCQA
jgi:hypothetical protein